MWVTPEKYDALVQSLYLPDSRIDLLNCMQIRCKDLFHPYDVDVDFEVCLNSLELVGLSARARVLKTWLNGWVTSHRMHEPVLLPCIMGALTK